MSPSPLPLPVQVTTTTVLLDPTAVVDHADSQSVSVPIAPIVGGSCAGILLAVLLVVGWKWWGRSIRRQQRKEQEKRRAAQAVIAYRRSVIDGTRSRPTSISYPRRSGRPYPASHTKSDSKVKFASDPSLRSSIEKPALPSPPSSPAALPSHSHGNDNVLPAHPTPRPAPPAPPKISKPPPFARLRTHPTTRPSPLAPANYRRSHNPSFSSSSNTSTVPLLSAAAATSSSAPTSPERASFDSPSEPMRRERPAADSALDAAATATARLSKLSQTSAASEYSQASDPRQRWSWRRLLTGPGFSFSQAGIGSGNDRLSAASSLNTWEAENPDYPIGYAYTAEEAVQLSHPDSHGEHTHDHSDREESVYPPEYFAFCEEDGHKP